MITFQIESLKNVTFNVVSFSVVDRSVGDQARLPDTCKHLHHKSIVAAV